MSWNRRRGRPARFNTRCNIREHIARMQGGAHHGSFCAIGQRSCALQSTVHLISAGLAVVTSDRHGQPPAGSENT
jgi:hypothetical protein